MTGNIKPLPMHELVYEQMVNDLVKNGIEIAKDFVQDPEKADLTHMALGVAGEAGELVDAIKKHTIYGKQLDLQNLEEELGDIEFYLQRIRYVLGFSREDILRANMAKLRQRYPAGNFSDKDAQLRADKLQEE